MKRRPSKTVFVRPDRKAFARTPDRADRIDMRSNSKLDRRIGENLVERVIPLSNSTIELSKEHEPYERLATGQRESRRDR